MKTLNNASSATHHDFDLHEASLAEHQKWDIIQTLPAAIYTCDAAGVITSCNQVAEKLWNKKPVVGEKLWSASWKIFNADGSPMTYESCPLVIALKERKAVYSEGISIEDVNGLRLSLLSFVSPVFDVTGALSGAVNILIDVTGKTADGEVNSIKYGRFLRRFGKINQINHFKEGYDRYHKMIDEVQDYAILMLDLDGNVVNWNKGAERIKGYTEAEIIGKNFSIFYRDEDRDNRLPQKLIREAVEQGRAMHEGWRQRKDGTLFWGSVVITSLHDNNNETIGFSKVTRDLTERKIAEDQLRDYARNIEFRNKQLEEYAFIASHDLQEPLRKIQTFANLLEKNLDNKEAATRHLEKINSSAQRMSMLIKDVLLYSRLIEPAELFVPTDLNEVLGNVMEDLDLLMEEKQARIIFSRLPVIRAIPIQIHQLFSNLINNSLKFTSTDPVIEVSCCQMSEEAEQKYAELDPERTYIKLSFKDNGIGFDQAFADKAFRLFQKLHSNISGTGIGLAICKKVVENHHGVISVASQPGRGATFDIILPV